MTDRTETKKEEKTKEEMCVKKKRDDFSRSRNRESSKSTSEETQNFKNVCRQSFVDKLETILRLVAFCALITAMIILIVTLLAARNQQSGAPQTVSYQVRPWTIVNNVTVSTGDPGQLPQQLPQTGIGGTNGK